MSTKISTVIKSVVKRDWNDLEPKLVAFLATGLTASGVIEAAKYAGITLDPGQAGLAVVLLSSIAGYIKSSSSKADAPNADVAAAPVVAAPAAPVAPVEVAPVVVDSSAPVA